MEFLNSFISDEEKHIKNKHMNKKSSENLSKTQVEPSTSQTTVKISKEASKTHIEPVKETKAPIFIYKYDSVVPKLKALARELMRGWAQSLVGLAVMEFWRMQINGLGLFWLERLERQLQGDAEVHWLNEFESFEE
jgi:hypothetical protein